MLSATVSNQVDRWGSVQRVDSDHVLALFSLESATRLEKQ